MRRVWTIARRLRRAATEAEQILWLGLRGRQLDGLRFRRQWSIGGFVADFACVEARLVVDIDGGPRAAPLEHAAVRVEKLQLCGYRVARFQHEDVLLHTDLVLAEIRRLAQGAPAQRCGRVADDARRELPRVRCPLCGA
jgi:very-short-patch-repair endonuclease